MKKWPGWFILFLLFEIPLIVTASEYHFSGDGMDSCTINDFCTSAIELQVNTDNGFTCINGCTYRAAPEIIDNDCRIGQFPTVWYKVHTGFGSLTMNIQVQSDDIHSPAISLFTGMPDCNQLQPVGLTSENLTCLQGYGGIARAIGTKIEEDQIYFIAVTDLDDSGGTFELCVNTLSSSGFNCVTSRSIEITSRSSGGSLKGPFEPGETIGVCFNVESYSAANNGCQWFQGMIPVFGNGWDPSSFDANGLPLNATINGNPMGIPGNGNYGNATWDVFTDVDYHFDNPYLQVGDLDQNGTVDMCNSLYDPHCPDLGGIQGGCCGPCWGNPLGTILPPGWLAYGINGTCPTPGPPIRVDMGDGNTCGGGMGPWRFCFNLTTRAFPDCDYDKSTTDLSLGFFTLTDGETGSWSGSFQACYDQPAYWRPGLYCNTETNLGTTTLSDQCSGNIVTYELYEPGVEYWEWTVTPSSFVQDFVFEAGNGHILESHPYYQGTSSAIITYKLIGHLGANNNTVVKKIKYRVWPQIEFQLPEYIEICEYKPGTVTITPNLEKGGKPPYHYLWSPGEDTLRSLVLHTPFQPGTISLNISDTIGCATEDTLIIKLKPCHFDDMYPGDEHNDTINPQNPLPHDGNFSFPVVKKYSLNTEEIYSKSFQIHPTPTSGNANVVWSFDLQHDATIEIFNTQGLKLKRIPIYANEGHQKQIDVQFFMPGVYLVRFSNEDFRFVTRMVKM